MMSPVARKANLPLGNLLLTQFAIDRFVHEDCFTVQLSGDASLHGAPKLLAQLLEGFLQCPPHGVTRLMQLRNLLVAPLGLRTASLGCPVSSLLGVDQTLLFANQYPVLAQDITPVHAQVLLGANDKHLSFRSCVAVRRIDANHYEASLSTRVRCSNAFGRFYMIAIHWVHLYYIAPTMLRMAVQWLEKNAPTPAVLTPA